MRARDSFGEAMAAAWRLCLSESVGAGDPLVVHEIAEASKLSATPVREALAWLAGQGLIERRVGRGYFTLNPSAADVAQLYDLHQRYLLWSLQSRHTPKRLKPAADVADVQERIAWLFRCIATSSGDAVLADAQGRLAARLRLLRRAESETCRSDPVALTQAETAYFAGADDAAAVFVQRHHAERIHKAGEIAETLRPSPRNIAQI